MHYNEFMYKKHAFSLVELSIVLVILGLLVGGILAGQSLIRAAELRSVSTEFQKYTAAIYAFRDKYFAIPGDMRNATSFWGDNDSACPDGAIANGTPGTCNGNADNRMTEASTSLGATSETLQIWNQLALAGLIEGTYTGVQTAAYYTAGTNQPRGRLNNSTWFSSYAGVYGDTQLFTADYGNYLRLSSAVSGVVLNPEETWNIDTKLDDGKPGTGKMISRFWNNACANAVSNTDYAATYRLSDPTIQCMPYFVRAF